MQGEQASDDSRIKAVAGFLTGTTLLGTLALTAPFVFVRSPLPYMATPRAKVRKALQHVSSRGKFVDLGSGDGEAVLQASRLGYQKVVGVELNFTLWTISKFRRQTQLSYNERQRTKLAWGNMFDYPLDDADTVLIFGVKPLMAEISRKLASECRPGTHVLAYRFELPLASPSHRNLLNATLVYDSDEMRIYKCQKPHPQGNAQRVQ